jgi:hypothetical protein
MSLKKLQLNKETLRFLLPDQIEHVAMGNKKGDSLTCLTAVTCPSVVICPPPPVTKTCNLTCNIICELK